jgi:hypothetical protein
MRSYTLLCLLLLSVSMFFSSCEEEENPITLPPKGNAHGDRVDMGEDYLDQFFYDFETAKVVMTSKMRSWDLAFESSASGYHVFINGGKDIYVYNTHSTDFSSVGLNSAQAIIDTSWSFDAACGLKDSTAVGEWKIGSVSKNEVYLAKFPDDTYKKFIINSVTASSYQIQYGDVGSNNPATISLPKNELYNYVYFSFDNGGEQVAPEPPKNTWDILFTRYRYFYYDLNTFPYIVTGCLLNPYNTKGLADSTTSFPLIVYNSSMPSLLTDHRDVIGFDWKSYDVAKGRYTVNPNKCYVIKTSSNQYWKIHFIDFYSITGLKGSPTFEFERIQ